MGTDYFEKEWIIENAMSQERQAQRKILFKEINFLDWCLKEYANNENWQMFSYTLNKRDDYLEIAYNLGLLSIDEHQKMKGVML